MTPPRVAAHLFVENLDHPEIGDDDRHHVERVLRLRPGEAVTVSDGRGGRRLCAFATGGRLDPTAAVEREDPRAPAIGVGFALVKGERPEWIVQKLTECGVDRIIPFTAARSVVVWDDAKAAKNRSRLVAVARGAAMQSRQVWLPSVDPLRSFTEVAAGSGAGGGGGATLCRADLGGGPPSLRMSTLLVGPEGGWSEDERAAVPTAVSLGPAVLRAETAAVAAAVLLTALRSGAVHAADGRFPRS